MINFVLSHLPGNEFFLPESQLLPAARPNNSCALLSAGLASYMRAHPDQMSVNEF